MNVSLAPVTGRRAPHARASTSCPQLPSTAGNTATTIPDRRPSATCSACAPIANFDIENSCSNDLPRLYPRRPNGAAQRCAFRNFARWLLH